MIKLIYNEEEGKSHLPIGLADFDSREGHHQQDRPARATATLGNRGKYGEKRQI